MKTIVSGVAVVLAFSFCVMWNAAVANDTPSTSPPSDQELLHREAHGDAVDRRDFPTEDKDSARWHSGRIEINNDWLDVRDLSVSAKEHRYLLERRDQPKTINDHLRMANWCRSNKFAMQRRAHLYGVLRLAPNHPAAREALGHQWDFDRWYTPEELSQIQSDTNVIIGAMTKWLPRLSRIETRLQTANTTKKLDAVAELEAIDDPHVIYPMELLAQQADDNSLFVKKLAEFRSRDSCLALVRIAISGNSAANRSLAKTKLLTYHRDFYVPELLKLLVSPAVATSVSGTLPNGQLVMQRIVMREVHQRKEMHQFAKFVTPNVSRFFQLHIRLQLGRVEILSGVGQAKHGLQGVRFPSSLEIDTTAARKLLSNEAHILDAQLSAINSEVEKSNQTVKRLLLATQRVDPGDRPVDWWNWWIEENERYEPNKPLVGYKRYETAKYRPAVVIDPRSRFTVDPFSCLIKGTTIQTSRGLLPVDSLQIGDLVLSQDVDTGELMLKPVLATTVRPPKATMKIVLPDETIQATLGHGWWVSGKGWVRTKELAPGMMLHTAHGNQEVISLELDSQPVPTYNLVVADNHNYFVGKNRLLSYDNTPIVPTLHPVPGYGLLAVQTP